MSVPFFAHSLLGQVARLIELAHHSAQSPDASIIRVANLSGLNRAALHVDGEATYSPGDDEAAMELSLLPVEPHETLSFLLGSITSPHWDAVGVAVTGTARELTGDLGPGVVLGPVRSVVLCARSGAMASVVRFEGQEPTVRVDAPGDGPPGRMADALRRSVGMSTKVPGAPLAFVMAQVWLHRIHTMVLSGERVDLALVEALRPAGPRSWSDLREQCAAGWWIEVDCSPELAAWMDDGMFSRWCVGSFPEPVEVMAELLEILDEFVFAHLAYELVEILNLNGSYSRQ